MQTNAGKMTLDQGFVPTLTPFEDGACGIVIQPSGRVEIFQRGMPMDRLAEPFDTLAPADQQLLKNGELLMVLQTVASLPELQIAILEQLKAAQVIKPEAANDGGS